ncbi:hypothetical protein V5F38_12220 [Xanthobacter sp. V0B-10]|uniref:hypothetical protein n=1 Tax=Xanthobacter albus TaxID=3119929 RepID=UPI00372C6574
MRAPSQKAPAPRTRAPGGAPSRAKAKALAKAPARNAPAAPRGAAESAAPGAAPVFRAFIATLEKLDRSRRRAKPAGAEG